MTDTYRIEVMSRADIARAVDWAAREGWNPGHADADCFAAVDSQGFMGGWLAGHMIASISVVNYGPEFSFLGFYIVDPEHRGKGYGYKLWQHAIAHAGDRLIGLDGVVAEQDNYRRSGFELAYRNIRYGGVLEAVAQPGVPGLEILEIDCVTPELEAFDRTVFPADRTGFLDAWLGAEGHRAVSARRDGALTGYGVIRPCRNGWKVGPLFASSPDTAQAILAALLDTMLHQEQGKHEIFLDVPEPNGGGRCAGEKCWPGAGLRNRPHVYRSGAGYRRRPDVWCHHV